MIKDAVSYRISRKVLPKITDEGYVEYGLQIPFNYQTRAMAGGSSRAGNRKKTTLTSEFGADIDWILKASGSISRGSAGPVTHNLGVNGASGQIYGSNVSLQSANSSRSNGSGEKEKVTEIN